MAPAFEERDSNGMQVQTAEQWSLRAGFNAWLELNDAASQTARLLRSGAVALSMRSARLAINAWREHARHRKPHKLAGGAL